MLLSHSFSPTPFLTCRKNLFYWQNGYQFHIGTYASLSFGTNKTGLPDGFSDKALIPTFTTTKGQGFYCELFFFKHAFQGTLDKDVYGTFTASWLHGTVNELTSLFR